MVINTLINKSKLIVSCLLIVMHYLLCISKTFIDEILLLITYYQKVSILLLTCLSITTSTGR